MVKHCVRWKPVKSKSQSGKEIFLSTPEIIDVYYKGSLLSGILNMPAKVAISLESAINLHSQQQNAAFTNGRLGEDDGHYSWYSINFVSWISSLGYHIELTGDEFESCVMSEMVA